MGREGEGRERQTHRQTDHHTHILWRKCFSHRKLTPNVDYGHPLSTKPIHHPQGALKHMYTHTHTHTLHRIIQWLGIATTIYFYGNMASNN